MFAKIDTEKYKLAVDLIEKYQDTAFFHGKISENLITQAENLLKLSFPKIYKNFLSRYGAVSFGSSEIYGIVGESFWDSSVPNGIWLTLEERKVGLPENLVVIYAVGDGWLYCLDCNPKSEKNFIVSYYSPAPQHLQKFEIVFNGFGEFLLTTIENEI